MSSEVRKLTSKSRTTLRQYLTERFDIEGVKSLCFDLRVNFDSLRGEGLEAKARELVSELDNTGRIHELIQRCRELRPTVQPPEPEFEPGPPPPLIVPPTPRREFDTLSPGAPGDRGERPKIGRKVVIAVGVIVLLMIAGISFQYSPFCSSVIFDTMDDASTWVIYTANETTPIVGSLPGRRNKAVTISYNLQAGEWILITRNMQPRNLIGTDGIGFYYAGNGTPNTIELKLFYENDTIFSVERNRATNTQGWEYFEAFYTSFKCWTSTGCFEKDKLNLDRVVKMDIAVSSKNGGVPGPGIVMIDDMRFIRPWSWVCLR